MSSICRLTAALTYFAVDSTNDQKSELDEVAAENANISIRTDLRRP